jgi:ribosomal protein L32E
MFESQQKNELKQDQKTEQQFCPSCQYKIEIDDVFCPECGLKTKQEEIECIVCSTINFFGEFCSDCGANLQPKNCPKCSTETYGDFCESCGVPVSTLGQSFLKNSATIREPEPLSMAEANEILKSFQNRLSPETKRMQEKMRQRIILQREREIFQEREERIKNYHSSGIKKVEVIQTEEFKKIREQMKTFSGYIKRKVEEKQAIDEVKKAEESRLRMTNRVNGIWVLTTGNICITCEINNELTSTSGRLTVEDTSYEFLDIIKVNWDGNLLTFNTDKRYVKWHKSNGILGSVYFNGRVSDDGESMMGYLKSGSVIDEKSWQVIFIKN